jgi:hypothetical protein
MSFTTRYQEALESVVLDNILAVIKRDFKGALDLFYSSDNLPDLTLTLGDFANFRGSMPALAIEPASGGGEQSDHFETLSLKVSLYLAVEDADPTNCLRKLLKYVRALRAVLKSAPISDYTAGISPNYVFGMIPELSWQYFIMGKDAEHGTWGRNVKLELTLKYNER